MVCGVKAGNAALEEYYAYIWLFLFRFCTLQEKKEVSMGSQMQDCPQSGAIYGLGFIGAAIYFIAQATSFWMGVLGFLKAIVWPAFLVYEALKYISA